MAEYVVMPKLGFDMREGVLVRLLKAVGDPVAQGDVVAEIESDKATLELEAQASGVLRHWLAQEGDVVPVGANLAVVGNADEDISALLGDSAPTTTPSQAETDAATSAPSPVVSTPAASTPAAPSPAADLAEFPGGVKATPVARRLARDHQLNLKQVAGSGPGGRVRKADVEAYLAAPPVKEVAAPARPVTVVPPVSDVPTTVMPTTRLRQAIARRMTGSKTTTPHFYVTTEMDMGPAMTLRQQINAALPDDEKVSVNDMIVKAAALALREFPNLNASFGGDQVVRYTQINIGTAVAVEGGLLTVVQRNTDVSPLRQVARDNRAMIARARSGKVQPDDITGSTFSVSNLGAFDVDHFIAIINPPEAAILAVGSVREMPVVVNGQLSVGQRMKVTVSADHRVTDGAEAARFLQAFKAVLEMPLRLLL